ncbi:hypothetical protein ACOSQ3_005295 [Xanthoceras sorbifolium]
MRIPTVVHDRHWERYVEHPNDASENLVREFYASIIPEDFFAYRSILVKRHPVTLTPELVNNYFQVPNFPELVGGWALIGRATYNRLAKARNAPGSPPVVDEEMEEEQGQDLGHQESASYEHEQPQVQPQGENCLLAALAGMEDRLTTRMDAIEIRLITSIDVISAMEARLTTRMDRIRSTLFQTYACRQADPSWSSSTQQQPSSGKDT